MVPFLTLTDTTNDLHIFPDFSCWFTIGGRKLEYPNYSWGINSVGHSKLRSIAMPIIIPALEVLCLS